MRTGMGILEWPPSEFWESSRIELDRAYEGWLMAHGVDLEEEAKTAPLTMPELHRLMEMFPDE